MVEFEIPGRPMVKKNTQRVYGRGKSTRAVYSEQFRFWENVALLSLKKYRFFTDQPIELHLQFHFKNRRAEADVSNLIEGPQDVLKKAGKIKDDKQVMKVVAEKFFYGEYEGTIIKILTHKGVL